MSQMRHQAVDRRQRVVPAAAAPKVMRRATALPLRQPEAAAQVQLAQESSGAPLPNGLRSRFEGSLGQDLSDVRVHTGGPSAAAAEAVSSRAYTLGRDIHFAAGQFAPGSSAGQELIAHEVAHTVQQAGVPDPAPQAKLKVSMPGDAAEQEADVVAAALLAGRSVRTVEVAPPSIQRAPAKPAAKGTKLTPEETKRLQNAKQLLAKAAANVSAATSALQGFAATVPSALEALQASWEATTGLYDEAHEHVNAVIEEAGKVAAFQGEMLGALVEALTMGLGGEVAGMAQDLLLKRGEIEEGLLLATEIQAWGGINEGISLMDQDGSSIVGKGIGKATDAGKGALLGEAPGGSVGGPWARQVSFYQSLAELQKSVASLLPMALRVGSVNGTVAKGQGVVEGIESSGLTRPDYPITQLEGDAGHVWNGTQILAAAAPAVAAKGGALMGVVAAAMAIQPAESRSIERELWIRWMDDIPLSRSDVLDQEVIQAELTKHGILRQLGVESQFTDDWVSAEDEALALVSADAQAAILAHKGGVFEIWPMGGKDAKLTLPGLPTMPVDVTGVGGWHVKAVVVGVHSPALDSSLLEPMTSRTDVVRRLHQSGLLRIQMTGIEDVSTREERIKYWEALGIVPDEELLGSAG